MGLLFFWLVGYSNLTNAIVNIENIRVDSEDKIAGFKAGLKLKLEKKNP